MRKVLTIWSREMASYFFSPVAFVVLVAFLAIEGLTFWYVTVRNIGNPEPLSVFLSGSLVFWLPGMVTLISMRLFSDEKCSGTIEMLMTAPVTDLQVVLGKYFGALSLLFLIIIPAFGYVFVFERLSPTINLGNLDLGAVLGGVIIILLVASALLSIAIVVSLVSRTQIISATCTFVLIWFFILMGWIVSTIPRIDPNLIEGFSVIHNVERFSRGSMNVAPVLFYLSVIALMLFISTKVLEARQWK